MTEDWKPYVVQQGDHLKKLAFRFGVDADVLRDHAQNKELAEKRGSMERLHPGDVLFHPPRPSGSLQVTHGTTNRYRATVPTVPVRVAMHSGEHALSNQPFEVHGVHADGTPIRGTAGENGEVEFEVPVFAREVTLRFPEAALHAVLRVGDLDPIDEPSGVVQRLQNLGLLPLGEPLDAAAIAEGVRAFQSLLNMKPTGRLDEDTRTALRSEFGV